MSKDEVTTFEHATLKVRSWNTHSPCRYVSQPASRSLMSY